MNNKQVKPDFYSLREVANILNFSYSNIRIMVIAGEIPAYRISKRYRVAVKDLEQYIDQSKVRIKS